MDIRKSDRETVDTFRIHTSCESIAMWRMRTTDGTFHKKTVLRMSLNLQSNSFIKQAILQYVRLQMRKVLQLKNSL